VDNKPKKPIDIDKKSKKEKDAYEKVKSLVIEMYEEDDGVGVKAITKLRRVTGRPPVELFNSSLEEALKDLYTLEHLHDESG
jgi:hypothetical protein